MKVILVTGVSGVGKSALSLKLSEKGYTAYDAEEIEELFRMFDKNTGEEMLAWDNDDPEVVKRMNWVCDVQKLKAHIANQKSDFIFYCGASSNNTEIIPLFDTVVLLTADEQILRERLSSRTSNNFGKVKEVQDMVIGWKNWFENETVDRGAITIDTNKNVDQVADEVIEKTSK